MILLRLFLGTGATLYYLDYRVVSLTNRYFLFLREFRILVIDAVMATDMSLHFEKLKKVKSMLSETRAR